MKTDYDRARPLQADKVPHIEAQWVQVGIDLRPPTFVFFDAFLNDRKVRWTMSSLSSQVPWGGTTGIVPHEERLHLVGLNVIQHVLIF